MRTVTLSLALSLSFLLVDTQAQTTFVDDAGRSVALPARVDRIVAAGAPAEVLLYTLAPDKLAARNRVPEGAALEFFPSRYRTPTLIRQLPEFDNPAADAELVALKPDLYVDYGTVSADYIESVEAVQRRTRVPGIILDGAMSRIPAAYRRLGTALGMTTRGEQLAAAAERIVAKYRNSLASTSAPLRVYLACSPDGARPCLADDSAGEQLAVLGAVNVAGTRATAPARPLSVAEIKALSPDVIVMTGPDGTAAKLRADKSWQSIEAVAKGRVHQFPGLPYSWGARPPSVNRLAGVIWMAYVLPGRALDAAFFDDVRGFFRDFYHLELTDEQIRRLAAS